MREQLKIVLFTIVIAYVGATGTANGLELSTTGWESSDALSWSDGPINGQNGWIGFAGLDGTGHRVEETQSSLNIQPDSGVRAHISETGVNNLIEFGRFATTNISQSWATRPPGEDVLRVDVRVLVPNNVIPGRHGLYLDFIIDGTFAVTGLEINTANLEVSMVTNGLTGTSSKTVIGTLPERNEWQTLSVFYEASTLSTWAELNAESSPKLHVAGLPNQAISTVGFYNFNDRVASAPSLILTDNLIISSHPVPEPTSCLVFGVPALLCCQARNKRTGGSDRPKKDKSGDPRGAAATSPTEAITERLRQ